MSFHKTLFIILITVFLSGCAHKEFINDGDEYISQGQHQLALEKYQSALEVKPKDVKTQQKVKQAQALFDQWLDQVKIAAVQAENNNLTVKAQLLYAKLAKHRNNLHFKQKQLAMSRYNIENFGLKLKLDIAQTELNQSFGKLENYVQLTDSIEQNKTHEVALSVSLSRNKFKTTEKSVARVKEYISGYETIVNPEYQDIQHDIVDFRNDIKELRYRLDDHKSLANAQNNELLLFQFDSY